mmetsp:Transcript_31626/g.80226  ORF Transcript_31626/g.80226 Transcript_31626/m.80226 type:complete len:346 (+) Transcript_31626:28-1065(+)
MQRAYPENVHELERARARTQRHAQTTRPTRAPERSFGGPTCLRPPVPPLPRAAKSAAFPPPTPPPAALAGEPPDFEGAFFGGGGLPARALPLPMPLGGGGGPLPLPFARGPAGFEATVCGTAADADAAAGVAAGPRGPLPFPFVGGGPFAGAVLARLSCCGTPSAVGPEGDAGPRPLPAPLPPPPVMLAVVAVRRRPSARLSRRSRLPAEVSEEGRESQMGLSVSPMACLPALHSRSATAPPKSGRMSGKSKTTLSSTLGTKNMAFSSSSGSSSARYNPSAASPPSISRRRRCCSRCSAAAAEAAPRASHDVNGSAKLSTSRRLLYGCDSELKRKSSETEVTRPC